MFGLKADWSVEVFDRYFTLGNYAGGEARWCPGCGDFAVLNTMHRVSPGCPDATRKKRWLSPVLAAPADCHTM